MGFDEAGNFVWANEPRAPSLWRLVAVVPAAWFLVWFVGVALWTPDFSAMADKCGTATPVIVALNPGAVEPDDGVDAAWCAGQARSNVALSLLLLVPAGGFGYLAIDGARTIGWSTAQLRGGFVLAALLVVVPIASALFPQQMKDEGCRKRPQLSVALGVDELGLPAIDARCQSVARSHLQALGMSLVLPGLALGGITMAARSHQRRQQRDADADGDRRPAGASTTPTEERS